MSARLHFTSCRRLPVVVVDLEHADVNRGARGAHRAPQDARGTTRATACGWGRLRGVPLGTAASV
jgi:hypothetical protein